MRRSRQHCSLQFKISWNVNGRIGLGSSSWPQGGEKLVSMRGVDTSHGQEMWAGDVRHGSPMSTTGRLVYLMQDSRDAALAGQGIRIGRYFIFIIIMKHNVLTRAFYPLNSKV